MVGVTTLIILFTTILIVDGIVLGHKGSSRIISVKSTALPEISFVVKKRGVGTLSNCMSSVSVTTVQSAVAPLRDSNALGVRVRGGSGRVHRVDCDMCSLSKARACSGKALGSTRDRSIALGLKGSLKCGVRRTMLRISLTVNRRGRAEGIGFCAEVRGTSSVATSRYLAFTRSFRAGTFGGASMSSLGVCLRPKSRDSGAACRAIGVRSSVSRVR